MDTECTNMPSAIHTKQHIHLISRIGHTCTVTYIPHSRGGIGVQRTASLSSQIPGGHRGPSACVPEATCTAETRGEQCPVLERPRPETRHCESPPRSWALC